VLSPKLWEIVQRYFGSTNCHDLVLMSLDSNAQRDKQGDPLRHFTPYPTPKSSGVNVFNQDLSVCDGNPVNAYVLLPFSLVGPSFALHCVSECSCYNGGTEDVPLARVVAFIERVGNSKESWCPRKGQLMRSFSLQNMALYLVHPPMSFWAFRIGRTT